MQYQEIIDRVQQRAGLDTPADAENVTKAVLATLGECLYRTERHNFKSQLPKELQSALYERRPPENARQARVPLEAFYNRVRARADIGFPAAIAQTKAVIAVLQEAVSAGEWADVMDELPSEYNALFEEAPSGPAQ